MRFRRVLSSRPGAPAEVDRTRRTHRHDRAGRESDDTLRDAADEQVADTAASLGPHHDDFSPELLRAPCDRFRRRSNDRFGCNRGTGQR